MKKLLLIMMAGMLVFAGCKGNSINVHNGAASEVTFCFRGEAYAVEPGAQTAVTEIPNGTYAYSSVVALPADVTQWQAEPGLGGEIGFFNKNTQVLVIYTSYFENDTGRVDTTASPPRYHVGAVVSSSQSSSSDPVSIE